MSLPCAFEAGDQQGFEVCGEGESEKQASYRACRRGLATLLAKNASAVVLRQKHWQCLVERIVDAVSRIVAERHQPLAVPPSRADRSGYVPPVPEEEADREEEVLSILRRCLTMSGGVADPSRFKRFPEGRPGLLLNSLVEKGTLRAFIERQAEFEVMDNTSTKGWSFKCRAGQAVSEPGAASSSRATNDASRPSVVEAPAHADVDGTNGTS